MWQPVDPNDQAQLQQAVAVLAAHDPRWVSADFLKQWILSKDAQVFYLIDPSFRLVVGFAQSVFKQEWRIAVGGGSGNLGPAAGQEAVQKIVDFTRSLGLDRIAMYNENLSATDPNRILLDQAIAFLKQDPQIERVEQSWSPIGPRVEVVLKQQP